MTLMMWAVLASVLAGVLLGLGIAWWVQSRERETTVVPAGPILDANTDRQIAAAAAELARRQGRPEAAGLIADKLRTAWALMHRAQTNQAPTRKGWDR